MRRGGLKGRKGEGPLITISTTGGMNSFPEVYFMFLDCQEVPIKQHKQGLM